MNGIREIKRLKLMSEDNYDDFEQYILIRYYDNDSIEIDWPFEVESMSFSQASTRRLLNYLIEWEG